MANPCRRMLGTDCHSTAMKKRQYDQYCAVACALDIVGERWAMLIVRELLSGPKRFVDLEAGLPGIGSGTFKVLALDTVMRLPMKVSTTTSNFMIGVTAAASAGIYFSRGDVPPLVAAPVALGVLLGAFLGTRLMTRLSNKALRLIFLPVMAVIALEMVLRGLGVAPI